MKTNTYDDFLQKIITDMRDWRVDLELSNNPQVYTLGNGQGLACSGFFAETPKPTLAVAVGKEPKEWIGVLAHEYSHACQWKENSSLWKNLFDDFGAGREEACDALDRWLDGDDRVAERLPDIIARIRDVERDCEERTVQLINAFGLDIDTEEYTQKANAYVYFYNFVEKTRAWYTQGREPYNLKEIWENAPKHFATGPDTPAPLAEAFERVYGPAEHTPKKLKI